MLKEDIKKFYRNVGTKIIMSSESIFMAKNGAFLEVLVGRISPAK